jgi:hypothetical protein
MSSQPDARTATADSDAVVYQRTIRGNAVTRDPNADMPRMMKTLLMAVDGKTSVAMFQKLLPNFGDVGALLLALQANGLVEPARAAAGTPPADNRARAPLRVVSDAKPQATPLVREPQAQNARFRDTVALSSNSTLSASHFEADAAWRSSTGRNSSLQNNDGSAFDPYKTALPTNLSGARHTVVEGARVREARSRMTNFLFQYRADVALEASLSLEKLETTEQMLVNLDEYKRLIASAGRVAVDHLAEVRRILSS